MGNKCKGTCYASEEATIDVTVFKNIENLNVFKIDPNTQPTPVEISAKEQFGMIPSFSYAGQNNDNKVDIDIVYNKLYLEIKDFSKKNNLVHDEQLKLIKKIKLDNDAIYIGQVVDICRSGYGIQYWSDGRVYTGFWNADQASGYGRLEHKNGDSYEGYWLIDEASGYGTYYYDPQNSTPLFHQPQNCNDLMQKTMANNPNSQEGASEGYKVKYQGNWVADKQHGFGKETWPSGAQFEGNYEYGYKCGNGKLLFADGSHYHGTFLKGKIDGNGQYVWKDFRFYKGQWKENKLDGLGQMIWNDGRSYVGGYTFDQMTGFGTFIWTDGRMYSGNWTHGQQHGEGKYTSCNGVTRKGEWYCGKRISWLDENGIEVADDMVDIVDNDDFINS